MLIALVLSFAASAPVGRAAERRSASCQLAPSQPQAVAQILDARTLRLTDGSEVRLAGLAALADSGVDGNGPGAVTARAKAMLANLIGGKTIAVHVIAEDRYGRHIALASASSDRHELLQRALLAAGAAVVAARVEPAGCAGEFLAAERAARLNRLGLWADPYYLVREADRPAAVAAARGRFALVQGKVLSVRQRGATTYVNFGRRWSEDFTVTIAKRNAARFKAAGLDPTSLAGRRILVRGWVDERGGPWIEAIRPEQIEFAN